MATKKKLLEAAAGSAGGAGALNVEDVFSTYLYEGNGSPQAIDNGIALGDQYDGGSANFTNPDEGYPIQLDGTISLNGDFTVEAFVNIDTVSSNNVILGSDYGGTGTNHQFGISASSGYLFTYSDPTFRESTTAVSVGTWQHIAISRSGSTIYFWLDGVAAGTGTDSNTFSLTCIGALEGYTGTDASFEGYMSNLRVSNNARYTSAFTAPTSDLADDANTLLLALQSTDPFTDQSGTYTLTADSSVKSSTFGPYYADAGEGGMVWFKQRNGTYNHVIFDTERWTSSNGQGLFPNATNAAGNINELASFNSNGFTVKSSGYINDSASDMASWTFRKARKFFTCLTYSGTGSAQNISHDLGATVGTLIVKRTDSTDNWTVWHRGVNSGSGSSFLNLNLTSGYSNSATRWNSTAPTSTQFSVGTHASVNASGGTYVAYLFAHNDGDGEFGPDGDADIIKCGSYTTDANEDATVDLGFEPQWVLAKRTDSSTGGTWTLYDSMRGLPADFITQSALLEANDSNAENNVNRMILTPTGFKVDNYGANRDYIYIAIRRGPMAVPTDATDVFDVSTKVGASAGRGTYHPGFLVDMAVHRTITSTDNWDNSARLIQAYWLQFNTTAAEAASSQAYFDFQDGWRTGASADSNNYSWMWRRAPSFCDVVCYTGDGNSPQSHSHNLGVAPEMMWVKRRNSTGGDWAVYHKDIAITNMLYLNDSVSLQTGKWASTAPTDTVFTTSGDYRVGANGDTYIAYLFASLDGLSKVGSYTGNGTSQNIDCGFSGGARFVLIKRSDSSGNWNVYDTARGIVAGNDSRLSLDTTDPADTSNDRVDAYSSGFTVNYIATGTSDSNISGATYIFYAIA